MKKYLNQPIVYFFIVAVIIFMWNDLSNNDGKKEFKLTRQTQEFLIGQNERLLGRPITEEEKNEIFNSFIQDEMLLNMAYERGLDRLDARIRESLIKNMRGVLLSEVQDPDPDSLHSYLESRRNKYSIKSAIDFETISIFGDNEKDLSRIDSMPFDLFAASYGERYANFVFTLPVDQLSKPIRRGEHLVQFKVLKYYTDENQGIDSTSLFADYKYLKSQESLKKTLETYTNTYDIVIE
ncbi:hypothetical protein [Lutimonas sp.]|uniref:hypothetical protein n=1 Tax=Lutimonas sp. TaxID=1872403 RepID=UPI003D9BC5DB